MSNPVTITAIPVNPKAPIDGARLEDYVLVNTKTGGFIQLPRAAEMSEAHVEAHEFEVDAYGVVTRAFSGGRVLRVGIRAGR